MLSAIIMVVAAFVIAGVPTGVWTARVLKGIDIRQHGSGSTGATNVWRCVSKPAGVFVFLIDLLKGYAPTLAAVWLNQGQMAHEWSFAPDWVPVMVALSALIGHSKSVFLGFQGGKSAATGLGTLFALCPGGGALTFLTWFVVLGVFKMVSLASILGVFSCGAWFALFHAPGPFIVYCVIGFIYVTYRHKANIVRMTKGTEPKINDKKEEPPTASSEQQQEAGTPQT
ncbi:MAG: glycerol-3-phosphate 1-O-acyltransferase PlsY [Terriglobales bacterium]